MRIDGPSPGPHLSDDLKSKKVSIDALAHHAVLDVAGMGIYRRHQQAVSLAIRYRRVGHALAKCHCLDAC
jgi:hypothetical protein